MDPEAAKMLGKLIGAGIACIGMGGAGVGVGVIFGNYLSETSPSFASNAHLIIDRASCKPPNWKSFSFTAVGKAILLRPF
ncbi:MAG: hypothetical protein ABIP89_14125, partial [Polyangiaceae bacterium]